MTYRVTREPNAFNLENAKCLYELSHLYVWINKLPLTLMCPFSEIFSLLCWRVIYGLWAWLPLDRNLLLKNVFLCNFFKLCGLKISEHCTHSFPFGAKGACFGIGSSCSFGTLGPASLLTKSFMVKCYWRLWRQKN